MAAKYGYIGNSPDTTPVRIARRTYTLTGIQTNFTFDAGYSIGYVDVYLNGVKQVENDDFIASDGSTVGFSSAPIAGDIVEIVAYKAYDVIQDRNNVAGDFRVYGNANISGIVTASSFVGNVTGSSTYAATAGIATYSSTSGIATYATTSGISTTSQGLTGTPNITVGVTTTTTLQVGSGSSIVVVDNMGELGIGTTSPITKFDLFGASTQSIVSIAASNIDCSLGNYFTDTINGNKTYTVSNVPSNRAYSFTLEVNNTSGTITWFSGVQWPGGTAPTLTTGKTHLFMFITDDNGSRWRASSLVNYTT